MKAPPLTFNGLAKLIRRRIVARPEIEHLTEEDQQSLVKYITNSVDYFYTQGSHSDWKNGKAFSSWEKSGNFEQTGKVREF